MARTQEHLEFVSGADGAMLIDYDQKGMPDDVRDKLNAIGGPWRAYVSVIPALAKAERVERVSTSAGLYDKRTGTQFPGSGGAHHYIIVCDASDIPRATRVLHDRVTLAGYGWARVTKGGAVVDRSIVDATVGAPERLVFEGAPDIDPPLAQDVAARKPKAIGGRAIDTRDVIRDLDPTERAALGTIRKAARQRVAPAGKAKQTEIATKRARDFKVKSKTTRTVSELRERFMHGFNGRLAPEFELVFDDPSIGVKTVAEVLADRDRFIGETLSDPLEGVEYGRDKAKVMANDLGGLFIHSFAHGGMGYRLMMDETMLEHAMRLAGRTQVLSVFLDGVEDALLFPGGEDHLIEVCATLSGMGEREVKAALKARRVEREKERRAARVATDPPDPRVTLPAPAADAEIGGVCLQIDAALARVEAVEPPMRSVNGKLARVAAKPVPGLHVLTAVGANAMASPPPSSGGQAPAAQPAPAEARLVELEGPAVAMEIERYIRLEAARKNGDQVSVRLPQAYWPAMNCLADRSSLPIAKGVQTLPLVLRLNDGSFAIRCKNGLDRALGLVFRIDPAIAAALPDPAKITLKDAKDAYRFLVDEWLVDVDTSLEGKAVLVSVCLSIIQRQLLPERPGFFVSAAQRGSGKTTAANMIANAVLGVHASASAWASVPEERRKALLAYFMEGVPFLLWDNIPRGSKVSDPEIEKSMTLPTYKGRVLGRSETVDANATTILLWTGNGIAPAGDLASRVLVAVLNASRPDPENRPFTHTDPMGWTLENRPKILAALYAIACVPRPIPAQAETRFKDWWRMVGHPIELVSGVRFAKLLEANNNLDPEASDVETVLAALRRRFGQKPFRAEQVAGMVRPDPGVAFADDAQRHAALAAIDELRSALEGLSGRPFPPGDPKTQAVGKKLLALEGRPASVDGDIVRLIGANKGRDAKSYCIEVIQDGAPPSSATVASPKANANGGAADSAANTECVEEV